MRAVDTNILVRLILRDDEAQVRAAEEIMRDPVWVANTVLIELGWVLGRRMGLDRAAGADALATILSIETVHVADRLGLLWAVERYRAGADWADVVHLVAVRTVADSLTTFDRALAQAAGPLTPVPVTTSP